MSVFERFWQRLTAPLPSRAICALTSEGVVAFDRRSRQSAFRPWTEQAFQPGFDEENVRRPDVFAAVLRDAARALGLSGERRWSALVPGATARTHVITLEAATPRQDVPEVILWKAERLTGLAGSDLWMTVAELGPASTAAGGAGKRFLLTAMNRRVALDLQGHLQRLGWQPGLILPRIVCESLWLQRSPAQLDQMLISVEEDTLAVMLLRRGFPLAIRTLPLAGEAPAEQLLRLLLFFREHAAESGLSLETTQIRFEVLAVNAPLKTAEISQCIVETFGEAPRMVEPRQLGFASASELSQLAGVAGLALATD
ncbi:MAG: hypothetical protein CFK52_10260 [Chloracidobacterium sp. CP2_5A]|nr:MAG: hypothetical protein CFK52_10260 [Chloracidobacterium sp. CP2_5A]